MPDRRYRVLAVATHPVQYMTPIFRRMAKHPSLDFHVAYCTLRGAEASHDPEFGAKIQWDVPVLDGHSWTHVLNRGSGAESFFGLFNPGLWKLMNAYLWLLLGILYRLPTLAVSAQFAVTALPAPAYDPRIRMR